MNNTLIAQKCFVKVLISGPFAQAFDYHLPDKFQAQACVGVRVQVPFGQRNSIGIIHRFSKKSDYDPAKIKSVIAVLDDSPVIMEDIQQLCDWAATYYHHSLADILLSTLPKSLRDGGALSDLTPTYCQLTTLGAEMLTVGCVRGPKQRAALERLSAEKSLDIQLLDAAIRKKLLSKQWLAITERPMNSQCLIHKNKQHVLNSEQQSALRCITAAQQFRVFVLAGVTGSGKTEVYLQAIAHNLEQGKSALVLVPEISLTPQTLERFQSRFQTGIAILHSKLNATERAVAWVKAKTGEARIIIGTRSALFTPIPKLGIIILDEEHDSSFKQQAGFRYHARSLATVRAKLNNIPIILGSATPSLEILYNVQQRNYQLLKLIERPTGATLPLVNIVDLRSQKMMTGLTATVQQAMSVHLAAGRQVMVFLNRRGFCPALLCHQCGYSVSCPHCEVRLVLHTSQNSLNCHHCGYQQNLIQQCPKCRDDQMIRVGQGTERLAEKLEQLFPDYKVLRIDSDTTQRKHSFDVMLKQVHDNEAQILVGTQMLAKGHHFANLSMVAMLDADYGFYSNDFRALENLAQLITQVTGRAGRENIPGEVYIQTHQPKHPLLLHLLQHGYLSFADQLLSMRQQSCLPPYANLAIFCVEDQSKAKVQALLTQFVRMHASQTVEVLGPVPASMPKRAGRYRFQVMLRSTNRRALHQLLCRAVAWFRNHKNVKSIKWSLDVDPIEIT